MQCNAIERQSQRHCGVRPTWSLATKTEFHWDGGAATLTGAKCDDADPSPWRPYELASVPQQNRPAVPDWMPHCSTSDMDSCFQREVLLALGA
jgi:hypothetical protein